MYLLAIDSPTPVAIGNRPVEVTVRAMGEVTVPAGPFLLLLTPAMLGLGLIAASPAVMGGRVWVVAVGGAQLNLAPGTVLGHAAALPPPASAAGDYSPAPAQPASADPPQPSKAKGKAPPRAATPDPTA